MGLDKRYPTEWSDLETIGRLTGAIHELKLLRNEKTKLEWTEAKTHRAVPSLDYDGEIANAPDLTPEQAAQRRALLDIAIKLIESRRDKLLTAFISAPPT